MDGRRRRLEIDKKRFLSDLHINGVRLKISISMVLDWRLEIDSEKVLDWRFNGYQEEEVYYIEYQIKRFLSDLHIVNHYDSSSTQLWYLFKIFYTTG